MADTQKQSLLDRIEAEARKVPPLPYVLFLFAVVTSSIWIPATVFAAAELVSVSLLEDYFDAVRWVAAGGMLVSSVVTVFLGRRAVRRQVALAEDAADISSFRLGWGAVRAAWRGWWSVVVAILCVVYVSSAPFFELSIGVDHAGMTLAGRYWAMIAWAAVISGLIFCFFGFCVWLGRRVQKQRAAP